MKKLGFFVLALFCSFNNSERTKETEPKIKLSPQFATAELAASFDDWLATTRPSTFNSIYSPVSIYNILAGIYFGTAKNSETKKELQEKFNFKEKFNVTNYASKLAKMTESEVLDTFNSYVFHKSNMMPDYEKELEMLNFKKEQFRTFTGKEDYLNERVKNDTDGMIKKMFEPGSFDDLTSLVLLNTILFNGKWDETRGKFLEKHTKVRKNWYTGAEEYSAGPFDAEFMYSKDRKLRVYQKDFILYISLKFKGELGKPVYMTIAMPKFGSKISAHKINFNDILKNFNLYLPKKANLYLPKFEIEDDHNLVEFMTYKNSTRLLNPKTADLDRMFGSNSGNFIGEFNQKASIKVQEKGVKAAAATGVGIILKSMSMRKRTFWIKRPFKFFIHSLKLKMDLEKDQNSKQTGNLFFTGVVNCPMNNCDKVVTDEVIIK